MVVVVSVLAGQAGSSGGWVDYLEKEQPGQWFTQDRNGVGPLEVSQALDANRHNLGKQDAGYYPLILSPSQKELQAIGNDPAKLQAYTRDVMGKYAEQFQREGLAAKNLVYFAKIEHERYYKGTDADVKNGQAKSGDPKPGLQTHVHVLVSRCEDVHQFKAEQAETGRKTPYKLSPATNHRNSTKGPVRGGFERKAFITTAERTFDQRFGYQREKSEQFDKTTPLENPRLVPREVGPEKGTDRQRQEYEQGR